MATNWSQAFKYLSLRQTFLIQNTTQSIHRRHLGGKRCPELSKGARYTGGLMGDKNERHVDAPQFNYGLGLANLKWHWIAVLKIAHSRVLVNFPHLQGLWFSNGSVIINSTSAAMIYLSFSHQCVKYVSLYTEGDLSLWDVDCCWFFFLSRTSSNNLKMPVEQIDTWEVPKVEVMVKKNKLHSNPEEEIACEPN